MKKNIKKYVGRLGEVPLKKGLYLYVGSAQGGLEKRIFRHLSKNKRKFWHIDYLLEDDNVEIVEIYYKELSKEWECKTASLISGEPILGFGSSDCTCKSHLFRVEKYEIEKLENLSFKKYLRGTKWGS